MAAPRQGAFDLLGSIIGLDKQGNAAEVEWRDGPPPRIDGFTVGAAALMAEPPHGGEMHPDGDELLYLVSGRLTVVLEDQEPPRRVELTPGKAIIVPRGVWHRVLLGEPSQVLYVTPGPGSEHRPPDSGVAGT